MAGDPEISTVVCRRSHEPPVGAEGTVRGRNRLEVRAMMRVRARVQLCGWHEARPVSAALDIRGASLCLSSDHLRGTGLALGMEGDSGGGTRPGLLLHGSRPMLCEHGSRPMLCEPSYAGTLSQAAWQLRPGGLSMLCNVVQAPDEHAIMMNILS